MPAVVDKTKCQKNYACIGVCPVKAIEKDADGFPVVETRDFKPNHCIGCGACQAACPSGAIAVQAADTTPVPEEVTEEEPTAPSEEPKAEPIEETEPETPEPEPKKPETEPEPEPKPEPAPEPQPTPEPEQPEPAPTPDNPQPAVEEE